MQEILTSELSELTTALSTKLIKVVLSDHKRINSTNTLNVTIFLESK